MNYQKILLGLFITLPLAWGLDWGSKVWAEQTLVIYQPVPVVGELFRLTLGYNTGVAFGLFTDQEVWLTIIIGVVIAGLALWFINGVRHGQFRPTAGWAIGLLLGGALGNYIDRIPDGRVTDFLDFGIGTARWPTFNLADSFILVGVVLLIRAEAKKTPTEPEQISDPLEEELI